MLYAPSPKRPLLCYRTSLRRERSAFQEGEDRSQGDEDKHSDLTMKDEFLKTQMLKKQAQLEQF